MAGGGTEPSRSQGSDSSGSRGKKRARGADKGPKPVRVHIPKSVHGFRFHAEELAVLEACFRANSGATPLRQHCVAMVAGFNNAEPRHSSKVFIDWKQIKTWFENRRQKAKRERRKAEEEATKAGKPPPGAPGEQPAAWMMDALAELAPAPSTHFTSFGTLTTGAQGATGPQASQPSITGTSRYARTMRRDAMRDFDNAWNSMERAAGDLSQMEAQAAAGAFSGANGSAGLSSGAHRSSAAAAAAAMAAAAAGGGSVSAAAGGEQFFLPPRLGALNLPSFGTLADGLEKETDELIATMDEGAGAGGVMPPRLAQLDIPSLTPEEKGNAPGTMDPPTLAMLKGSGRLLSLPRAHPSPVEHTLLPSGALYMGSTTAPPGMGPGHGPFDGGKGGSSGAGGSGSGAMGGSVGATGRSSGTAGASGRSGKSKGSAGGGSGAPAASAMGQGTFVSFASMLPPAGEMKGISRKLEDEVEAWHRERAPLLDAMQALERREGGASPEELTPLLELSRAQMVRLYGLRERLAREAAEHAAPLNASRGRACKVAEEKMWKPGAEGVLFIGDLMADELFREIQSVVSSELSDLHREVIAKLQRVAVAGECALNDGLKALHMAVVNILERPGGSGGTLGTEAAVAAARRQAASDAASVAQTVVDMDDAEFQELQRQVSERGGLELLVRAANTLRMRVADQLMALLTPAQAVRVQLACADAGNVQRVMSAIVSARLHPSTLSPDDAHTLAACLRIEAARPATERALNTSTIVHFGWGKSDSGLSRLALAAQEAVKTLRAQGAHTGSKRGES